MTPCPITHHVTQNLDEPGQSFYSKTSSSTAMHRFTSPDDWKTSTAIQVIQLTALKKCFFFLVNVFNTNFSIFPLYKKCATKTKVDHWVTTCLCNFILSAPRVKALAKRLKDTCPPGHIQKE